MKRFWLALVLLIALLAVAVVPVHAAGVGEQANDPPVEFSAELIGALAGVAVSLLFNYFPVLRVKFAALAQERKSLIMIGLMVLVVVVVAVLDFFDVINAGLSFDKAGITRIVFTLLSALVANQSTYLVSPQTRDVREAKAGPMAAYTSRLRDVG